MVPTTASPTTAAPTVSPAPTAPPTTAAPTVSPDCVLQVPCTCANGVCVYEESVMVQGVAIDGNTNVILVQGDTSVGGTLTVVPPDETVAAESAA